MQSGNKIVTTVIILLLLSVLFSGCIGERKIAQSSDSIQKQVVNVSSQNLTQSSKEENIPEIRIVSFSSIYMHDNSDNKDIYLFTWENVPGNQSHILLNFLKNDFNINWAENAQIIKDEDKTIHVFTDENSIELRLYNDSAQSWVRSLGLWVIEENGTNNVYYKKYQNKYEISERYYAVYNLSIRNNGSDLLYFKLDDLHLYEGDRIFNTTALEPYDGPSLLEVLQDLEKENKLQDTTLLPGQSLNGTVVFRVNSLYNESFLLIYNSTPITSASFEKRLEALRTAESFNYSIALGVPPYSNVTERGGTTGSYEPDFDNFEYWANWMNRSIFETYQKSDPERMRKSSPDNIPITKMVYALRVLPEKNISMFPVTTREFSSNLLVVDDAGKEMINTSEIAGVAVLSNQTYALFKPRWKLIMPRMNFSNASVVQISFEGTYGEPMGQRLSFVNQDIILDENLNIIVVRYNPYQFLS